MTEEPKSEQPKGTPEGYTKEQPAASELGEPGTPGAGLTPDVPHAADADLVEAGHRPADPIADAAVAHHDSAAHMDAHSLISDDDHGNAEAVLGPIDWTKWAYAVVGAIGGLIVLVFFWAALS